MARQTTINLDNHNSRKSRKVVLILFLLTGLVAGGVWLARAVKRGFAPVKVVSFDLEEITPAEDLKTDKTDKTVKFVQELNNKLETLTGTWGVYVYRLGEQKGYGINENLVMPALSMMKVPEMIAADNEIESGSLSLDSELTVTADDKREGVRTVDKLPPGSDVTVDQVLKAVGTESDNTAAAVLSRTVGEDEVEETVKNLGMRNSSFANNEITAKDAAEMWIAVYQSHHGLEQYLQDSIYEDRIAPGLPDGVKVVHKVGTGDGNWEDGGIIYPENGLAWILVIVNDGVNMEEAKAEFPKVVKMIWDFESGAQEVQGNQ